MLDLEFELNRERLGETRGDTTAFFAFADTVAARSFRGNNDCHGWMGVKFQSRARDEASRIIIHVRLLDSEAALQQEALGIVGVNLLYGAFFLNHEPEQLVESLLHKLTTQRLEIDMIEFNGIEFRMVDNRLMSLKLVELGLSGAAMFGANHAVLQPSEALYKRAILVERGSFRPVTHVNLDMLRCAMEKFVAEPAVAGKPIMQIMEITMRNLLATSAGGQMDRRDFLARADVLAACGMTVLVSDYSEYYRLAAYLARHTSERIGIVMGVPSLAELFNEKYYTQLPGGILESFGRLFKNDLKLYVYPLRAQEKDKLQTIDELEVTPELKPLYAYLNQRGSFVHLDNYKPEYLSIFSRDVLKKIAARDATWEKAVPTEVAATIKKNLLFGFRKKGQ
jgi:hypothetical protein